MKIITGWVIGVRRLMSGTIIDVELLNGTREQFVVKKHDHINKIHINTFVEIAYTEDGKNKIVDYIKTLEKKSDPYEQMDEYNNIFRGLEIRSKLVRHVQSYLTQNGFIDINIPIAIYNTSDHVQSPIHVFYLEMALLRFTKIYSFVNVVNDNKSSNTFYHTNLRLDAVVARTELIETMDFVENMFSDLFKNRTMFSNNNIFNIDELKPPFYRISYDEAVEIIKKKNPNFVWGSMIGPNEERVLSAYFDRPFWVMYLPRKTQPPLHRQKPDNKEKTMTSILLFPWYGKTVCVTEKIFSANELIERISGDGYNKEDYNWAVTLRNRGLPPHTHFHIDLEKFIKLTGISISPHVILGLIHQNFS